MTATNHALTGALIGLTVTNPIIAIIAAFLSHVVLDTIPHYGSSNPNAVQTRSFKIYLCVEAFVCALIVLALFLSGNPGWLIASICAFLATSLDFLWIRKFVAGGTGHIRLTKVEKFLGDIQWFQRPIGAVVEIVWATAAIILLLAIL